jgi:beta-galactosidase GanA
MKATGITVVRIAESTWRTLGPKPGVFDFSHLDRVLTAMDKGGIKVIAGTPPCDPPPGSHCGRSIAAREAFRLDASTVLL